MTHRSIYGLAAAFAVSAGSAVSWSAWATEPRAAPAFDTGAILKQVRMCKVLHGFVRAPCAGKLLGEKLLPFLSPIDISGLRATKTIIDLDTNDFKSKVAGWINKGLKWIGVPESFRIPKKIGYDLSIGINISDIQLKIPEKREYTPEFGAKIQVRMKVLSTGPFHNKTFKVTGTTRGKVYLTIAPYGRECDEGKVDWAMAVINLQLTKLDVDKIPNLIDGSDLFLKLVNWGFQKAFTDFPQYDTRGIPICVQGNCPRPPSPPPQDVTLTITAAKRYLSVTLSAKKSAREIRITDHAIFCQIVDAIVNSGCTDAFVNHMANTVLPITAPLPAKLGEGLYASADAFSLEIDRRNEIGLYAKARLLKKGARDALAMTAGAALQIRPQCDTQSFMMFLKPQLTRVSLSPLPSWLQRQLGQMAANANLPALEFCPPHYPIPGLGKKIQVCKLADAVLKERCTGSFLRGVADAVFPLSVRPAQMTGLPPALKELLEGIQVGVEKLSVDIPRGDERNPKVSVKVAIRKDGEREAFTASGTAALGLEMKCGKDKSALRLRPAILGVEVPGIPDWLLQATVVNVGNQVIGKWFALCVLGDCKSKQDLTIALPDFLPKKKPGAPAKKSDCSFDAVEEVR